MRRTCSGFFILWLFTRFSWTNGFVSVIGRRHPSPVVVIAAAADDDMRREIRTISTQQWASSSPDNNNGKSSDDFLETASKLRQEASELEKTLREQQLQQNSNKKNSKIPETSVVPSYKDMNDSIWTLSYLFSSRPDRKDDGGSSQEPLPMRLRGKLTVQFKADGYTDLISHESDSSDSHAVVKVWGWDVETSNDDGNEYLLFSVDMKLQRQDDTTPINERYYLQAKQQVNSANGEISFQEGTVTMKQDVTETGSRWGLFSTKGILAEFRYVGNFVARPIVMNKK